MVNDDLALLSVVDVETFAIKGRPHYPPKPVGVAIRWPSGKSEYLSFAHPYKENNCTQEEAVRALRLAYAGGVCFHNAKFDLEVIYVHLGIAYPKVWHDTLLLASLQAPNAVDPATGRQSFSLKPLAHLLLGIPPDEQTDIYNWVKQNINPVPEEVFDKDGAMRMKNVLVTRNNFGRWIAFAPLALQTPYAIGDVERTFRLFHFLYPQVQITMQAAYDRERRLMPHLLAAEQRGIRVDRVLLDRYDAELALAISMCDNDIRQYLNSPSLNLDSNDELADALDAQGLISHWETPQGVVFPITGGTGVPEANPFAAAQSTHEVPLTRSVSKGALKRCCTDQYILAFINYRNAASTLRSMFVLPWLRKTKGMADPRLHTTWHQVIGVDENGTRTGRIASSDPNLANVPNPNETPPPSPMYLPLPSLRRVLLPERGCVWLSGDYSQQELRITAHYEDGVMQNAYRQNPTVDLHLFAQQLVEQRTGKKIPRKHIKNIAFASIYGAGLEKLAAMMEVSEQEADEIREAYFVALPGLRALIANVKATVQQKGFVRSLGGRRLLVEPMKYEANGRRRSFDFKMPNKLIQGSAADMTKEAIVQFCEGGGSPFFLSQVYDEINISVPVHYTEGWARYLTRCMINAMPLDVPIIVDVDHGPSWGDLTPVVP